MYPVALRPLYKALFGQLQRGKCLEGFAYLDGHYLLSVDGTGYFSSNRVHCPQCAEMLHRNGTTIYYQQKLGAGPRSSFGPPGRRGYGVPA